MLKALKTTFLLFLAIGVCLSCGESGEEFSLEELFNPSNPETHGDPYNLRIETRAEGGVLLLFSYIPKIEGIAIYRSTKEDSGFEKIGTATVTKYIDEDVQSDATYYYRLHAYIGAEEFPASTVISIHVTPKSNSPMVLIPAGEFQMGSDSWRKDENPIHTVYLDAFYMDIYEVTNAQYRRFVNATGHQEPEVYQGDGFKPWDYENLNGNDNPVTCINFEDAMAYCKWAGKRLPTEAEWEKAARGGLIGNGAGKAGNIADETFNNVLGWGINYLEGYDDGYAKTAPVGSFSPNGYGLYDMSGNVGEWCSDWYGEDYYKVSPKDNPKGPDMKGPFIWYKPRVYRGSSWNDHDTRIALRHGLNSTWSYSSIGFRCANDVIE